MDSKAAQKIKILEEIEDTFKKYRSEHPEQVSHFPDALKRLPLLALSEGIPQRDIARAAGLTPKSMRYWRNRFAEEQVGAAKKLKLVEQRLEPIESDRVLKQMARITLKSGVVIEVPPSELSTELLSRLCELTGFL